MKFFLVLVILACISTACFKSNRYANVAKERMQYHKIVVSDFTVSPYGVAEDDPKNVRKHLHYTQEACIKKLDRSGLFESAEEKLEGNPFATLIVRGELLEMRIVGGATRAFMGWTAGKSDMAMLVRLYDARTGNFIAEHRLQATIGNNVDDSELTTIIGQQIADFVIKVTTAQAQRL